MNETIDLDLDVIAPQPKTIKLNNRTLTCYPLTVEQLFNVIRLQDIFNGGIDDMVEAQKMIRDAFEPLIPELKSDKTIKFYFNQMKTLIEFAQKISIPEPENISKQYEDPKKKVNSAEESPTS